MEKSIELKELVKSTRKTHHLTIATAIVTSTISALTLVATGMNAKNIDNKYTATSVCILGGLLAGYQAEDAMKCIKQVKVTRATYRNAKALLDLQNKFDKITMSEDAK